MKKLAIAACAALMAMALAGCGGSAQPSSSASASAEASSSASVEASSAQASTVFGDPQVVDVKSGSGAVIGTSSIFHAAKADCTEENLATWYGEYVEGSGDNWCVILFTDDAGHGVYANNGMIEVGVGLEEDTDGSYMLAGSDEATTYVYSSGALKKID